LQESWQATQRIARPLLAGAPLHDKEDFLICKNVGTPFLDATDASDSSDTFSSKLANSPKR
jgi:hypothetical protein